MSGDWCHLPWGQWSQSELLCWGSLCCLAIRSHLHICLAFPSLSHIPNVPSSCLNSLWSFPAYYSDQDPAGFFPPNSSPVSKAWEDALSEKIMFCLCTKTTFLKHWQWLPVPGDSHGIFMARAASTGAQHQVVSQTPSSGLYAKTSCVWNACWVQLTHSQKSKSNSPSAVFAFRCFFLYWFSTVWHLQYTHRGGKAYIHRSFLSKLL